MNLKNKICIEVMIEDRSYQFCMDDNAPLGQAYDAAFHILKALVDYSAQAVSRVEAKKVD